MRHYLLCLFSVLCCSICGRIWFPERKHLVVINGSLFCEKDNKTLYARNINYRPRMFLIVVEHICKLFVHGLRERHSGMCVRLETFLTLGCVKILTVEVISDEA